MRGAWRLLVNRTYNLHILMASASGHCEVSEATLYLADHILFPETTAR